MPSTVLKGLSVQSAGSNAGTWGAGGAGYDLNTGVIGILDNNLAGVYSASLSSSNVSLSSTDVQNCLLRFTGTLLANIVVSPAGGVTTFNGFYFFENYTSGSFSVTLTTGTGSVVLPQSRGGIIFVDTTNAPRILAIVGKTNADPIPVGTVMTFYQTSVPTGWTAVSLDDYALKIVSNGSGGVTSGSVGYATLFARTETDSHALSVNEIPSHTHYYSADPGNIFSGGSPGPVPAYYAATYNYTSSATGGGAGHTHNIDMRVKTAAIILGTKN